MQVINDVQNVLIINLLGWHMLNQDINPEFNNKGYLADFSAWNKDLAIRLAEENGVELADCHWLVIEFLRNYYSEYELAPDPREIIKQLSKEINPTAPCTRKHLDGLFGKGGCKLACKIAGLPDCHCRGA
jgi:TusE/DsrC/DsvC family sulfur relay protein